MKVAALVCLIVSAVPTAKADQRLDAQRERIVASIMTATGATRTDAIAIETSLEVFIDRLEGRLQYLAGDFPLREKQARIQETIREFFVGGDALVEVSSVNLNQRFTMKADEYLNRLANLRQNQRYTDVRLNFRAWDFNGIARLPEETGTYEAGVTVWQVFQGTSDTGGYADETRKKIRVRVTLGPKRKTNIAIEQITVAETTDLRRIGR